MELGKIPLRLETRVNGCIETALIAGNKIKTLTKNEEALKGDEFVGHHAIVTTADNLSQETILGDLGTRFPEAYFITEEKTSDSNLEPRVLTGENYIDRIQQEEIFGVDPLDGTSQHRRGLYEWSVSNGIMVNMHHLGGAIYAPDIKGGTLVFGDVNNGVYLMENNNPPQKIKLESDRRPEDAIVYTGPDMVLDPGFNDFANYLGNLVRTTKVTGSAAVGLACAAVGKIDVLFLHPVRVWDWFAGHSLVEIAGRKMQFYRLRDNRIEMIGKLQPEDYNPDKKEIGFFAGSPSLVDQLSEELVKRYKGS